MPLYSNRDSRLVDNADGGQIQLGAVARILKWLNANITFTGSGSSIFTMPASTSTLASLELNETLANKILTTPTIASFVNATHNHQSAVGGGQFIQVGRVSTDFTTTSTSLVDVTGLAFSIGANEVWAFECYMSTNVDVGTAGMQFAAKTGPTVLESQLFGTTNAVTGNRQQRLSAYNTATGSFNTGAIDGVVRFCGIASDTAADTFQVQVLKVTSQTAKIYANSFIVAWKIA